MENNDLKELINIFLEKNNLKEGVTNVDISNAWFKMMKNTVGSGSTYMRYFAVILFRPRCAVKNKTAPAPRTRTLKPHPDYFAISHKFSTNSEHVVL